MASYDEFGAPQYMSGAATSNAPPARYGWLGAAQRSADTPTGVLLMGVRLYHPGIGRFLQVDPVAGGSASAYDYCNADPVNCTDLGGTIAWGRVLGAVAAVGEVASFIPGPIGAAAAGISAVAYAANGNKGKALLMGVTAAATLVGAGLVVRGVATLARATKLYRSVNSPHRSFRAALYVHASSKNARLVHQTFSNGKPFRSSAQSFVYHYAKHGAKYKSPTGYVRAAAVRLKGVAASQSRSVRRSPGGKLSPSRVKWDTFW